MKLEGEIKIITGSAFFALIPVAVKFGEASGIYNLIFGRALIAAVLIFIFSRNRKLLLTLNLKKSIILFSWSTLMTCAIIFYFLAIESCGIAVSAALLGIQPILIVLLSVLMLKEKLSGFTLFAVLLTVPGILCLTGINMLNNSPAYTGQLLCLLSALLLALNFMIQKKYLTEYSGKELVFYQSLFQLPFVFPFIFSHPKSVDLNGFAAILMLAVFCTILAYTFIYNGIKEVPGQKVGILQSIEYILPVILGVVFYSESLSMIKAAGIALILLACLLVNFDKKALKSE